MMSENRKKTVYVPMVADYLHPGHLNIINVAATLGEVTVGLFSDKAVASYKRLPFMNYEQRKLIIENIKGVSRVVAQNEKDYEPNLRKYKPDYMVHGTDWQRGPLKAVRENAIKVMSEWGGTVVEPEYTKDISSTLLHERKKSFGIMPNQRLSNLKRLLEVKPFIKVMEAHNAISALIVENTEYIEAEEPISSFDAIWISSLTDSTAKGKPNIEFVDLTSRMSTVNDIIECTTKPIIYDGDTGGQPEHFALTVRRLERLGISAVIIEDKAGSQQDSIEPFCNKIKAGKLSQINNEFMILARLEGLNMGEGVAADLIRAKAYIASGADGIVIHLLKSQRDDILQFCECYNKLETRKPLIFVAANDGQLYEQELREMGINVVIYANQLLRAAYTSMLVAAETILKNKRSFEADQNYISVESLIDAVNGN